MYQRSVLLTVDPIVILHFKNKLLSTTQFSDTKTKAVLKKTMLSGVKFLLDFFGLHFAVQLHLRWEFSLVDMSGYNHPVRRKRYSEN